MGVWVTSPIQPLGTEQFRWSLEPLGRKASDNPGSWPDWPELCKLSMQSLGWFWLEAGTERRQRITGVPPKPLLFWTTVSHGGLCFQVA